jgi:hypothetical protein
VGSHRQLLVTVVDPLEEALGHVSGLHHNLLELRRGSQDAGLGGFQYLQKGKGNVDFLILLFHVYGHEPAHIRNTEMYQQEQ